VVQWLDTRLTSGHRRVRFLPGRLQGPVWLRTRCHRRPARDGQVLSAGGTPPVFARSGRSGFDPGRTRAGRGASRGTHGFGLLVQGEDTGFARWESGFDSPAVHSVSVRGRLGRIPTWRRKSASTSRRHRSAGSVWRASRHDRLGTAIVVAGRLAAWSARCSPTSNTCETGRSTMDHLQALEKVFGITMAPSLKGEGANPDGAIVRCDAV
jgi:hypothetical protein